MLTVLADRTYRHLFIAQVVALLGTGLATVALGLIAYDVAGGDAGIVLGTAFAVKMVAYVFVAPLASAALAKLSRRGVMVGADIVRLAAALCLPFVGEVWQIYVLIFVLQSASAVFTPTFQSVIPQVLPREDDYTAALSLSRLAYDLESVLSPMFAGALLLVVSSSTLFFGTALGFAGSALLVVSVVLPRVRAGVGGSDGADDVVPFRRRVSAGVSLFLKIPQLRAVMAFNLSVAATGAFVLVQSVVIVRDNFELSDALVPIALAANGVGSMAAAFALPRILKTTPERRVMLSGAALLVGAMALVPLALWAGPVVGLVSVCLLWVVIGVGWSSVETPVGRLIRRYVPASRLPDAFAAQFSLSHACWLVTYPLAGWLGSLNLAATAWGLGGVSLVAALVAAKVWSTGDAQQCAGVADDEDESDPQPSLPTGEAKA